MKLRFKMLALMLATTVTQAAMAQKISDALQATLATPEVRDRLKAIGFDAQSLGPAEFGPFLRSEIVTWARLIKEAGVQPE